MSTARTAPCAVCPELVDLTTVHSTVTRSNGRLTAGDEVEVLDVEVIATMHLICAQSIGAAVGQNAARAER